jgi:hypothetical protein
MMLIRGIIVKAMRHWLVVSALLVWLLPLPTRAGENTDARQPWFLHLNGIGGERVVDHTLISGLRAAGFESDYQIYDWTGGDIGITALQQRDRHPIADLSQLPQRRHGDHDVGAGDVAG